MGMYTRESRPYHQMHDRLMDQIKKTQAAASIRITTGPDSGHDILLERELVLGRKPTNRENEQSYALKDKEVSRNHAKILVADDQFCIEDLNSTNGTFVDGKRVDPNEPRVLKGGEEIVVGTTSLLFVRQAVGAETGSNWYQSFVHPNAPSRAKVGQNTDSISLRIVQDKEKPPRLTRVLDASRSMILDPEEEERANEAGYQDLVKRLQAISEISVAMGTVTDREQLMQKIVEAIFDIFPSAQRAFVMLRNPTTDELIPVAAQHREGEANVNECAVSSTIVNEVITHKRAILSVNAMDDDRFGTQQSILDFSIRALMCSPLLVGDEVLGLLQVDTESAKDRFGDNDLKVLTGLSTQAAIAVKNTQLYTDIEQLFEGFINASVMAIESRDPATAGHSFRVATFTERLALAVDRSDHKTLETVQFNRDEIEELRYAALLHDFGKVGVREQVLTKSKKLHHAQLALLRERFNYARANVERELYRNLVDQHCEHKLPHATFLRHKEELDKELQRKSDLLSTYLQLILHVNEPTVSAEMVPEQLNEVLEFRFLTEEGREGVLLHDFEFSDLAVLRGSLNDSERREIQSHVSHTYSFLSLIPWPKKLESLPEIAFAHHEKLDGSGYPRALTADQIPVQTRILTIADIYDALTSGDRPYKTAVDAERALDIMAGEVAAGKIDGQLFDVFKGAEVWRSTGGEEH